MTADPKVSPRPWSFAEDSYGEEWWFGGNATEGAGGQVVVWSSDGENVCVYGGGGIGDTANAAHIVRCVNAHDGLVEALEALSFTFAVEVTAAGRFNDLNMKLIEQASAALAAAKEGA